jgi:hypothetical protein
MNMTEVAHYSSGTSRETLQLKNEEAMRFTSGVPEVISLETNVITDRMLHWPCVFPQQHFQLEALLTHC